jgi:Na+/melibiose symporter-like transporter
MLEKSYSATAAFQMVIAAFALLGLILMLIPILFLNENRYAQQNNKAPSLSESISGVSSHTNFKYFVLSDLLYWLALTFIQLGMVYFVTLLFGMEKEKASEFLQLSFVLSFPFYFLISFLNKRVGKKPLMLSGFVVFIFIFACIFLLPSIGVDINQIFMGLIILTAYALAVFGVLPNVIIADIVNAEEAKSGQSQAAVFYGTRNFMMKMGISLANLLFPSFLLLGKSVSNPIGVRYSVLAALVFSFLGMLVFLKFKEEKN